MERRGVQGFGGLLRLLSVLLVLAGGGFFVLPLLKRKKRGEEEEEGGCFLVVVVGKRARSQYWGLWTKYLHSHSGSLFRQSV